MRWPGAILPEELNFSGKSEKALVPCVTGEQVTGNSGCPL